MHIEEIVLENFKSFGRRTRIPFYEDFTTISGPNGSGKSNIIDAVLFALGLARTRGMRAQKLTDLIYNPSHEDGDASAGPDEASVEVVLNNDDRTLERSQVVGAAGSEDVGDVDTITVRRRVKRTDENYYSYYYLNGRSVNLSDVRDLLAAAGVSPEGYNVVMQGDVTGIINMTPVERREIVDEIAGVAEFDAKKADAHDELEVVTERIEEADLRIEEKRERLDQLADERETALAYQDLREQKAEQESYVKAAELGDKRAALEDLEADIEAQRETVADLRSELDSREGKVVRLEDELAELDAEIERTGEDEQLRIKREIEEVKGEIGRLEDTIEAAEDRIEAAEADRREAFVEIDRTEERIEELEDEIRAVKVEKASVQSDIQSVEAEIESIEAEIEAVDTEYDELKAELADRKDRLDALEDEKHELQREQDRLLDEARRRSNELEETEDEIEAARERLPEIDAELEDLADELEKARRNLDEMAGVVEDLKAERSEVQSDLDAVEDDLAAARQEYAELEAKAEESGDASYGRAVTAILESDLDGVHGTVAQLGSVAEQYATACETAAGGRMAHVVVADDGVGQQCIDYLKRRNAGRATFLPLTEMDDRPPGRPPDRDGVVDFAYELVDFEDRYAGVFSYVLGSTLVVEDMETARSLMGDYRLVTLSGDLVEQSGAMTGGSSSGSRYSFTAGEGQLERVARRIEELEDDRQAHREQLREVEERLEQARDRKSEAADKVRAIESDIEDTEAERDAVEAEIEELTERREELAAEREAVDEEMNELETEIESIEADAADVEAEIEELEAELADSKVPELTAQKEERQADLADLRSRRDDLDGDLNELQLELEYAEESIEEHREAIEEAQNRKADAEAEIADLEERVEAKEDELEEKEAAVAELEEELADLKAEREDLRADLSDAREARDEAAADLDRAEGRLESLNAEAESLREEIADLEAAVGDHDPQDVPDLDTVEREIERLEAEMSDLEPVNMLAIDEYDEVEADLADLEAKRETLVEERDGIRERIDSYEAQKRAAFMDAFRGIDEEFQRIFERLSDGTGELHLDDPEDPFEGGLTMKAEPEDKPIQRLDAMSGGEKSLTALAFIFAIQRYNPAPFYALDEVDAFLDAANAERVGELVDELAREAQFVVVSHRSAMLERSERAIGVTMQEDNVSAVTGIDLTGDGTEVTADD
ncbi:MAG: chromosome segregation protein SMC [Halobacteriaceae archaeon]